MRHYKRLWQIKIILIISLVLFLNGCASRTAGQGSPIEPIAPGVDNGEVQALQGGFTVRSSDVQLRDLSVTRNGSLTLVATASRGIYLLENDGNLLWEAGLSGEPLVTHMDPDGSYLAVGTAEGELLLYNTDQSLRNRNQPLNRQGAVDLITASQDGEHLLVRVSADSEDEKNQEDTLLLLDNNGQILWEETFPRILNAQIAGSADNIFVNWLEDEEKVLAMFNYDGEQIWELQDHKLMVLSSDANMLISAADNEVVRYNRRGEPIWSYAAEGPVNRVLVTDDGSHVAAIITDEATQNEQLHYLAANGEKLWTLRLPDESEVLLSPRGNQIIVSSWRQYRDDSTQVITYNREGEEINNLGVAGRAQKMSFADRTSVLVLGLEDGRVYYLSIRDQSVLEAGIVQEMEKGLKDYYTPVSFERAEGESLITLFFHDDNAQNLIPVTRRIQRSPSLLRSSIEELVRGPLRGSRLNRTIPKDSDISVSVEEGVVQLDLPAELDEMAGTTFLTGVLDSLLLTVSQFPTVEQVRYTVGGEEQETFGQEGLSIGETYAPKRFGRQDPQRLIFVPAQSDDKYYLRMTTNEFLPLKDRALLETLVRHVLAESQPFFSYSLELQAVSVENNVVQVDLTDAVVPFLSGSAEAAARAAMLRDAIALTIAENVYYSQVQITVDGEEPVNSELYLPWSTVVSRPYFVNLED